MINKIYLKEDDYRSDAAESFSMNVYEELTLYDIRERLWSDGQSTANYLSDDELVEVLTNAFSENEYVSITDINDFLWHETSTIAEWLGYNSFDDIMHRDTVDDY